MRLSTDIGPSHRLSKRPDDGKGPSRVFSLLNEVLPRIKKSFPTLKERLELQRDEEVKANTDEPQFISFSHVWYGIRRDYNEWFLHRSL